MDLFGTAGIRGPIDELLSPELAVSVGRAVAEEAASAGVGTGNVPVVVGWDGRTSSPAIADALCAGLASRGAPVLRAGTVPTPTLAHASRGRAGVMITASHNPPSHNGIKCFLDGSEVDAAAEAGTAGASWEAWSSGERIAPIDAYLETVREYARGVGSDPDGLTVAVDCGNGLGSLVTPQLLAAMGADVRAIEATLDGHFPSRDSKPTADSLAAFRSFVPRVGADIGIAHDGDADRIVLVDGNGDIVHEDTVLAIVAEAYVRAHDAETPVVITTPNASGRIDDRVTAAGGRTERVALGTLHEGLAAATEPVAFAAEPWKHVHPDLGPWIDGVASAAVITRLVAAAGLDSLRAPVTERPYRKESVDCPSGAKTGAMEQIASTLPETYPAAEVSTEYGVRLSFDDGSWVLVRPSGTEPYVRIYAESDDVDGLVREVVSLVEDAVTAAA